MKKKLLIFIASYNVQDMINNVLDGIEDSVWFNEEYQSEVLIIDNQSTDNTFNLAERYKQDNPSKPITVLCNPKKLGCGGSQKLGYHYAIIKGFDVVVYLDGDGQCVSESISTLIKPVLDDKVDAVFGSKMIDSKDTLIGGMPFHKWVSNKILAFSHNRILGTTLSEFQNRYRVFSVKALKRIPFRYNSDCFIFNTEIIIQFFNTSMKIKEMSIAESYGSAKSPVNSFKYVPKSLLVCILSRMQKYNLFYHPKFDYASSSLSDNSYYCAKFGYPSSHQYAFDNINQYSTIIDVGCGPGFMAAKLAEKRSKVISIDKLIQEKVRKWSWICIERDIENHRFEDEYGQIDSILLLDIIEHLKSPESALSRIRKSYSKYCPKVIITTGNLGFLTLRLGLLFDKFNYGKKGILDLDHSRLFTFTTLKKLLVDQGYEILEVKGLPAPFPLAVDKKRLAQFCIILNILLIKLSKRLFAYQIAIIARPNPTVKNLLDNAYLGRRCKLNMGPIINEKSCPAQKLI